MFLLRRWINLRVILRLSEQRVVRAVHDIHFSIVKSELIKDFVWVTIGIL
jgi:hypothetical protein